MKIAVAALAAASAGLLVSLASPGAAQAQVIAGWNVSNQWDRGGDYRCDAYWDANRTDCDAAWRTPRGGRDRYDHERGRGDGHGRGGYGYGRARSDYGHGYGYGYGHGQARYAQSYGHAGYGRAPAVAYQGAYGRPDLVYGGDQGHGHGYGYGHGQAGRDPHRVAWCRASYRSYDPRSGYYRAYSGRLVYCG